jgi:hypothetical protein
MRNFVYSILLTCIFLFCGNVSAQVGGGGGSDTYPTPHDAEMARMEQSIRDYLTGMSGRPAGAVETVSQGRYHDAGSPIQTTNDRKELVVRRKQGLFY